MPARTGMLIQTLMPADSYYTKGWTHTVCQDYAIHGSLVTLSDNEKTRMDYGLVSDGCSSSDDTDIGSRLILRSAYCHSGCMQNILRCVDAEGGNYMGNVNGLWTDFAHKVAMYASKWVSEMELDQTALDATLLGAFADNKWACTASYGDGSHIVCRRVGTERVIEIEHIDFLANAPPYPVYLTDNELQSAFANYSGNTKRVMRWTSKGEFEERLGGEPSHVLVYPAEEVEFIAVVSDGVSSFGDIGCFEVIQAFTAFRNYAGEFVKRRMMRALDEYQKSQHVPSDDVSMAVVYARYGHAI
jgi:hypothetical protein